MTLNDLLNQLPDIAQMDVEFKMEICVQNPDSFKIEPLDVSEVELDYMNNRIILR